MNELMKSTEWELIDNGIEEIDVYDIETENHMFFGNDILIHNSVYINFSPIVEKYLKMSNTENMTRNELTDIIDKMCKKVENDCIMPAFARLQKSVNFYQDTLHMDREVICIPSEKTGYCGFWVAKKHYCLLVQDMEGYRFPENEPKQKSMGLYYVQSSCPEILQKNLKDATRLMIEEGEEKVREYCKQVKKEFMSKTVEDIAFPKSISDVLKFMDSNGNPIKGTPVHGKAAIFYNKLLDEYNLTKKYNKIKEMDKMNFLYLKPNPKEIDVIGFIEELPKEFDLEKYVDYDTHFEKAFRKPLDDMMVSVGWSLEKKASLRDLF